MLYSDKCQVMVQHQKKTCTYLRLVRTISSEKTKTVRLFELTSLQLGRNTRYMLARRAGNKLLASPRMTA